MSKITPKKINYMDMKIPLENFRIPKARGEQIKLIKRFETEFGKEYRLDPLLDPCEDYGDNDYVYSHGSIDEKIERIKRRNDCVRGLAKAIAENDEKKIKMYNFLRRLPVIDGSDNGWNVIYKDIKERNDNNDQN